MVVVRSEMMSELGLEDAFVLADGALVSLARVKAHVVFQMIPADERLIAFRAFVRALFLAGVLES